MTGIEMKLPGDMWDVCFSEVWRRVHAFGSKPRASVAWAKPQHISARLPPSASRNLPFDARTTALTRALNADKGVRTRAVHLVIVEQTLRQGVAGGLSAVPAEVLEQAIAQLRKLSLFRSSLDLQRLCESMRLTVKAQTSIADDQQATGTVVNRVSTELLDSGLTTCEPGAGRSPCGPSEPPQRYPYERNGNVDDDFPDTQAFDGHDEIVLPMPPTPRVDRGVAMGTDNLWR